MFLFMCVRVSVYVRVYVCLRACVRACVCVCVWLLRTTLCHDRHMLATFAFRLVRHIYVRLKSIDFLTNTDFMSVCLFVLFVCMLLGWGWGVLFSAWSESSPFTVKLSCHVVSH